MVSNRSFRLDSCFGNSSNRHCCANSHVKFASFDLIGPQLSLEHAFTLPAASTVKFNRATKS